MARSATTKLYRNFVRGLITEADFLTYPENASRDELNTVINRKGNRTRRLGLDIEADSNPYDTTHYDTDSSDEYLWKSPGNKAELNFLCVKVNRDLYVFDTSASGSSSGMVFTANLFDFKSPTSSSDEVATSHIQMISGKGYLFVVGGCIEPFVLEYDPTGKTFTTTKVLIQTRDFDGLNDGLANDEQPANLSPEHHYNLINQGWVNPGASSSGQYINPWDGEVNRYDVQ